MTNFSILTVKKFCPPNCRFVVYTDKPDHYKFLSSFVETRKLDEKTLSDWQGKQSFVWRIKLMAMLDSAEKDTGHLIYMDSDTFALGTLSSMIERLDEGSCLMYTKEGTLAEIKVPSRRNLWKQTKDRIFGDMTVNDTSTIWNAGVVGINEFFRMELITKALASTDSMCEQEIERNHIEQLSLSQALSSTRKLESADSWIMHYYTEKEDLTRNIHLFLSNVLLRMHSIEKAISLIEINHWRAFLVKTENKSFQRWFNEI
jgi:lipopolysaccharide biosynthesis glycosyltransferase